MVLKACDRCYSSKEKCTFTGNDQQCARCRRLKIACSTSRRNRRIGRRPAAKAFPHGEMQVWSVDSDQPFGAHPPPPPTPQRPASISSDGGPSTASTRRTSLTRRSKSKSPSDESVEEVRDSCRYPTPIIAPERLLASSTSLRTASDALRTVSDPEQFSVIHLPFMLGPSFVAESQTTVYQILRLSGPTLTEGYLAFLGMMTQYQRSLVLRQQEPDMVKAAKGLQRLRDVKITQDYDAACALFLGQTMYVFNVLTAPHSSSAHAIVRSALMSTKAWVPRLVHFPMMDTVLMTPMLIDTVECLVRREVPIIRMPATERVIVDRYAGVCATLLPLLYDLCVCSHTMRTSVLAVGESPSEIYEQLADVERMILDWTPPQPSDLLAKHGQWEVLAMMTQANAYRLAALLVVHRLRYPLGVEDETGRDLAQSIFALISQFAQSAAQHTSALPVVFPLTMAMIEVEGPGEEIWEQLSLFAVQSSSATRLRGFIKQVRGCRESQYEGLWFDLVDTQLDVAMPP
ncbi:hypothetical protein N7539_007244 [Penicillium diatomitis]|uniref:Zn(2)-C6 fungal-type domain-containing protein n=1 Tax=Penicillium diatomitis TaxID=2819901 RepID=A0A9W9WV38_9EURO|nr:uncharacterized protein N7539_007244 [Penicillium diatomitis]KAJ5477100.1 hypothetical protein N7539_007244 [Penicillium diatomitis]